MTKSNARLDDSVGIIITMQYTFGALLSKETQSSLLFSFLFRYREIKPVPQYRLITTITIKFKKIKGEIACFTLLSVLLATFEYKRT
jgi:hypothetical protein